MTANAKKIATSLPGRQYVALERTRKQLRLNRSQAIQEAIDLWIATRERDERVVQYLRGYTEHPDDVQEARAVMAAWTEGLAAEEW